MKKTFNILTSLFISALMFSSIISFSQGHLYSCVAVNDTLLNAKVYQFDVYLFNKDVSDFYLNNYQLSFKIDNINNVTNGGTITASVVPGSSELPSGFAPQTMTVFQAATQTYVRVNAIPFWYNVTLIPSSGLRIGTFQIINSVDFGQTKMDIVWNNSLPATTQIKSGIPQTNIPNTITDMSFHEILLVNPLLNVPVPVFNVVGGGDFCEGNAVPAVGLDGSSEGVQYKLFNNSVPVGADVLGTKDPIMFTNSTEGVYTVEAYRTATYLSETMNGFTVCNEIKISPTFTSGNTTVTSGTIETYTTEDGKSNYVWDVIGGKTVNGGSTTDNYIKICWGTESSSGSVSIIYTDNGCTAVTATVLPVIINLNPFAKSSWEGDANWRTGALQDASEIMIYPNPANSLTTLTFSSGNEGICSVVLSDLTGKTIMNDIYSIAMGNNSHSFDISGLKAGSYLLSVKQDDVVKYARLQVY